MDYDAFGANDKLAVAYVRPEVLYGGNGERLEITMDHGVMAIRSRVASEHDVEVIEKLEKEELHDKYDPTATIFELEEEFGKKGYSEGDDEDSASSLVNLNLDLNDSSEEKSNGTHSISQADDHKQKKYVVKPYPDPNRENETHS